MMCVCFQMLYNDQSPMENHHVAASFAVLTHPNNNFLDTLSRKVSKGVHVQGCYCCVLSSASS